MRAHIGEQAYTHMRADDDDDDDNDDEDENDDQDQNDDSDQDVVMKMLVVVWKRKTDPKTGKHTLCAENRSQDREAHVVRACAVETHMDISQEPVCAIICRKHAAH